MVPNRMMVFQSSVRLLGILMVLGLVGTLPHQARADHIKQKEYLWIKVVKGDMEEVLATIRAVAGSKNFPVSNVRNYGETFPKRLKEVGDRRSFDYSAYMIIEACNVMLAIDALELDPLMGAFMPCRLFFFSRKNSPDITVVTINPYFMPHVLNRPDLEPVAKRVAKVMTEIFQELDF